MDWEARYQEQEIPWEKGEATPVLAEISQSADFAFSQLSKVLVPGCGFGHDARWLAKQECEVTGLDISRSALAKARKLTPDGGVEFELHDFFAPDGRRFEALFEHTCFCAIDPTRRDDYVSAASEWLQPGGLLIGVFFLNPENESGGPPYATTRKELTKRFENCFDLVDEWEPRTGYEGRVGREWVRVLRRKVSKASSGPKS